MPDHSLDDVFDYPAGLLDFLFADAAGKEFFLWTQIPREEEMKLLGIYFRIALEHNRRLNNQSQLLVNLQNGKLKPRQLFEGLVDVDRAGFFRSASLAFLERHGGMCEHLILLLVVLFNVGVESWIGEVSLAARAAVVSAGQVTSVSSHRFII